jgi:hypothetical protein
MNEVVNLNEYRAWRERKITHFPIGLGTAALVVALLATLVLPVYAQLIVSYWDKAGVYCVLTPTGLALCLGLYFWSLVKKSEVAEAFSGFGVVVFSGYMVWLIWS